MFCCVFIYAPTNISAQTLNLLPDIPEPLTNPHLATAFSGVKTGDVTFNNNNTEAEELLVATMAYLHPSSPYRNQQVYLDRALFLLDKVLGGWNSGAMPLNDMIFGLSAPASYLMLKQYKPSALTPQQQSNWEAGIRKNVDAIITAAPEIYSGNVVGALWLNGDIRLACCVYFGGIVLNDSVAVAKAKNVIEVLMPKTLLNDGATHYVGYQNESPSYHGEATIRSFTWYYIFTKSQVVKDFICATNKYIPLVNVPIGEGYKEWSTSPAWKPYYNRVSLKIEALAKAYLGGDQYNYTIGQGSQYLYLAFLYRSGLSGATLPGNYMLYDKNSMGPRGIYGNWGVVGTLRDPSNPLPELTESRFLKMDGVNTIVGAFTLNTSATTSQYPLNAAFQGAAPQVKYSSGTETDWSRGLKWAFLTGKDRNDAQTRSKAVYGLSTNYGVSKSRFSEVGWKSQQQWVVTPDRVIGMTEIESSSNSTSAQRTIFGLAQRIQLVSGRLNASGTKKTLVTIDANTYEYGDLRIKIISKNFDGTVDAIYHGVLNTVGDDRSVMLNLNDINSQGDTQFTYPVGTRRYAFFEVTNKDRSYSTNASRLTLVSGLEGFEFTESSGRKIRMIHNVTGSAIALNTNSISCPYGSLRMLKSWDETTLNNLTVSGGIGTIPYTSIPAYGHIMIINSDKADDHISGMNQCEDLFNASLSFPSNLKVDSAVGTTINLSWKSVTGATSYVLKRSKVAGGPYLDVTTIADTKYADTGLNNNASYYYVLVAKKSNVISATSEEILGTTPSNTTWNGSSWSNGVPNSDMEAIVNGDYNTSSSTGNGAFTAKKLTINSGILTISSGTNLTVVNEIINNAGSSGVIVENNANLIQVNNVSNTGAITVKRNSNPLKRLDYTMWSSPVSGQNLSAFSPLTTLTPSTRFYTYDPIKNLYDSINPLTNSFLSGFGYLIRMPNEDPNNLGVSSPYYNGTNSIIYNGVFTGIPNNGIVTLNGLNTNGYYAIGNPYPSTISADLFLSGNQTDGTLYFWRKTNDSSNSTGSAYATWTSFGATANGVAPNDILPNGIIQVGQGFIVKNGSSSNSLVFNNSMRVINNNNQFFKTEQLVQKDRIWLNLTNTTGVFSQALIGYMNGATLGVDNGIDGKYINDSAIALTSSINNEEYTIQGRPAFNVSDVVGLHFKTDVSGNYSIALEHFDGVFATGQDVYLVDSKTGTETNLKTGSYTFSATAGVDASRFSLKYQKTLKIDAPAFNENNITVYKDNGILYVKSKSVTLSEIKVYDVQGRLLAEQNNVKDTTAVISNLKDSVQVLIVKIKGEDNSEIIKKIVN